MAPAVANPLYMGYTVRHRACLYSGCLQTVAEHSAWYGTPCVHKQELCTREAR